MLALVAIAMVPAACGSPNYTYVKNADAGLYLKVPRTWTPIDQEQLQNEVSGDATTESGKIARAHAWHVAFDAAVQPSVKNVFGAGPTDPVLWVFVRDVPPAARGAISLNALRDTVLPVTTVAEQAQTAGTSDGFEMLTDTELNPRKGFYGMHTVFNYKVEDVSHTVDQTVLTNDMHTKLYYLVVRCSTKCFAARRDEISTVVNSFTVRG
jgi:hypothetical protein